ncbi:hypothetical protein [Nannocystis pusilla]|uniref:hypothetical protein n=1 Tax=Nannocystis pusilla TaxID=889268 RepID=UPI003B80C87C
MDTLARQAAEKTVKLGVTTAIDKGAGVGTPILSKMRDDSAAENSSARGSTPPGEASAGPCPRSTSSRPGSSRT